MNENHFVFLFISLTLYLNRTLFEAVIAIITIIISYVSVLIFNWIISPYCSSFIIKDDDTWPVYVYKNAT